MESGTQKSTSNDSFSLAYIEENYDILSSGSSLSDLQISEETLAENRRKKHGKRKVSPKSELQSLMLAEEELCRIFSKNKPVQPRTGILRYNPG